MMDELDIIELEEEVSDKLKIVLTNKRLTESQKEIIKKAIDTLEADLYDVYLGSLC